MKRILEQLNPKAFQTLTSGQRASLVRTFQSAASKEDLTESEAVYFLNLLGCSKAKLPKIVPIGLSLKMLKISYPLTEDGTLPRFCIRWPHSAMILSTDCLIQNSLAFLKTENEFLLSLEDILEAEPDEKYFLSPQQTEKILLSL